MRVVKGMIALIAVLGWIDSAHAGTVTQTYKVSSAYGASWKTYLYGSPLIVTATGVAGAIGLVFTTPSSTFTKHQSNPPKSASIHADPSGGISARGVIGGLNWTVRRTIYVHVQGSTMFHMGTITHTSMSATVVIPGIPASGHLAGLSVSTRAHCTGGHTSMSGSGCTGPAVPGCWTGMSDRHTQTWKAKSIHCGDITFSHTSKSAHYLRSCRAKLVPPIGHSCGSGSAEPHLASSDHGYHRFHIAAKLQSTP